MYLFAVSIYLFIVFDLYNKLIFENKHASLNLINYYYVILKKSLEKDTFFPTPLFGVVVLTRNYTNKKG